MKSSRFRCLSLAVGLIVSFGASSSWATGAPVFSVGYYNLQGFPGAVSDNTLRIVNPGTSNSSLDANIYVFDANQNMLSCCSCVVSQNGSLTLSVINNLLPGSSAVKTGVIEVVSSGIVAPSSVPGSVVPAPELDGWLSHWIGSQTIVEQQLEGADLSAGELAGLETECATPAVHVCNCGSSADGD